MRRKNLNLMRLRRAKRTRSKIYGTALKPRLSVFRSHRYIYGQLIDDSEGKTLVSAHSREIKGGGTKSELAKKIGKLLAEKASKLNIKSVVFDRGGYRYHGRIKALAEAAREGGLKF
ncbi:MAG: 50S ribosomal protein L18 [Patescibacteria group bacterium]